jgi:hypothetical protein
MALSYELRAFCDNWRRKAEAYPIDDLRGAFDRFFTSYVAFNRLYAEATYRLARHGKIRLRESFPDSRAAQEYVVQYCGAVSLTRSWRGDQTTANSLREIADHLRAGRFALKLNPVTGERRPEKDRELLAALDSRNSNQQAKAALEALYAIRCNMFHGQKGFNIAQVALLKPAILLLERTTQILYEALDRKHT